LIIRKYQMEAFEETGSPQFENLMVEHLKDFSPLHSASLGDDGMRTLIRVGRERAGRHGFTARGPVQFYIDTIILLGVDFDTDPQYPWIAEILNEQSTRGQMQRADRVHAWLMEFLEAAGGPGRQYARQALARARGMPLEGIPVASETFADEIVRRMKAAHPEKASFLGDDNLRGLIPRAVEETKKYSVSTDEGVSLFVALMYAVGHGFAGDPKYPWVSKTLTNPAITDPSKRVQRLYSKTMTYLDHVLQHLQGP
jgi:hypothetical protein